MSKSKQQQAIEQAASEKIKQPLSDRIFRLLLWTAVAIAAVSMLVTVVMFYTEFLDISREGASATHSLLKYVAVYMVLISAVTFVIARVVKQYTDRHLAEPINRISSAAKEYILDKSDGTLDDMTHFKDLHLDTDDELEHLALVLRDMEVSMVHYMENLTKVTREKERISTELDLAQRIQENMLPNVFPPYPDRHDLDIHASMDPAKEVGGDFYDFFLIDHNHLGLVMADVAGKGIPAALFMMMARIMINYSAKTGVPPAEVLRRVNERICENNEAEMFVTVWLGILDRKRVPHAARGEGRFRPSQGPPWLCRGRHGGRQVPGLPLYAGAGRHAVPVHGRTAGGQQRKRKAVRNGQGSGGAECKPRRLGRAASGCHDESCGKVCGQNRAV